MPNDAQQSVELEAPAASRVPVRSFLAQLWTLDSAALVLRVAFGVTLASMHGLNKLRAPHVFLDHVVEHGFPAPMLLGWLAILSEFVGGLLLALGLFTRPAAALIATTLLVAAIKVHANDPFARKELALAYAVVGLAFLVGGGGRYALDAALQRKRLSRGRRTASASP
jgi:putative oxidoreductase